MNRRNVWTILTVCILLLIYGTVSWISVRGKSPTFDEPVAAMSAYTISHTHDFRLEFDNPPLWKYWVSLLSYRCDVHIDQTENQWRQLPSDINVGIGYSIRTLYQTAGNHADDLIVRSRFMMLLPAIALGAVISLWAYQLGGRLAAIFAAMAFAFDPNFLAHGPLMKNDVAIALCFFAAAFAGWRLERKVTFTRIVILGLICGAGCTVKFSGILILPIIATLIAIYSIRQYLNLRRGRVFVFGFAQLILIAIVTWIFIWACYGFRFSVSPNPSVHLNTQLMIDHLTGSDSSAEPLSLRLVLFALDHHLLPEAWLNGLLVIFAATLQRPSFLMGQINNHSWLWYYPLAMLFKTPIAVLIGIFSIPLVWLNIHQSKRVSKSILPDGSSLICLLVPPVIYALAAMVQPTAVGIRHILPVYPFLFVILGCVASRMWLSKIAKAGVSIVLAGLMIETALAFPNYISFFNAGVGGWRGGFYLLGDSNLDWGQDLPLLAQWQRENPNQKIYLAYFGTADPGSYGIRYTNLPGGYEFGPPPQLPEGDGVIAVSATTLQGVFGTNAVDTRSLYAPFRAREPMAVLGGSIYLFEYRGEWR